MFFIDRGLLMGANSTTLLLLQVVSVYHRIFLFFFAGSFVLSVSLKGLYFATHLTSPVIVHAVSLVRIGK